METRNSAGRALRVWFIILLGIGGATLSAMAGAAAGARLRIAEDELRHGGAPPHLFISGPSATGLPSAKAT
jgi:hypothetical protein